MAHSRNRSTVSSQGYVEDDRNESVLVYLNGALVKRQDAKVSVFDAGFALGDGVWEGLRLVRGNVVELDAHLERLYEGAAAIQLEVGMDKQELKVAIAMTLEQNKMHDNVHIRLMVTRGVKKTPTQDPRFALGSPTIVIVAEYKATRPETFATGLRLLTSTIRCSTPDVFDMRLNSHSRLNYILALIQAINAGCDEALMLDSRGVVASCNSTNFFIIRKGELWTSTGLFNFCGITRRKIIDLYRSRIGNVLEKDFTLAEVYSADEAFTTGTLGGVTPVSEVDGRVIGDGKSRSATRQIRDIYLEAIGSTDGSGGARS
jgi:branched-chain amino acid aminotransferase